MMMKLWEGYKSSPAQKHKKNFYDKSKHGQQQRGAAYARGRGKGRGKNRSLKNNKCKGARGKGRGGASVKGGGKGKGKGKGPASGQGNTSPILGTLTILDINPINLDSDYVTYVI